MSTLISGAKFPNEVERVARDVAAAPLGHAPGEDRSARPAGKCYIDLLSLMILNKSNYHWYMILFV